MDPFVVYIILTIIGILAVVSYVIFVPNESKALLKANPIFKTYEQVTKLTPLGCPANDDMRLCDYYMASSSYSVFPGSAIFDYVSDRILPLIIKSGARLVELDIYADENDKPVVGLKNQKLGVDYAYNTVPFEACCISIANNAFNTTITPLSSDPFAVSLVFHTDKTNVMNACAEILKNTCRAYLLDSSYSYTRKNLAVEPICNLQKKLIVVSGGSMKGTLMEELVNLSWSTSHLRRLTYFQASQPHDHEELINNNRDHITMVVPEVGYDLVNSNPTVLLAYGCQWNLMNYGSVDTMMELYIGEFQEASLVVKPPALRPLKPKQYKTAKMQNPDVSFQPMQKTSPIYNITI